MEIYIKFIQKYDQLRSIFVCQVPNHSQVLFDAIFKVRNGQTAYDSCGHVRHKSRSLNNRATFLRFKKEMTRNCCQAFELFLLFNYPIVKVLIDMWIKIKFQCYKIWKLWKLVPGKLECIVNISFIKWIWHQLVHFQLTIYVSFALL